MIVAKVEIVNDSSHNFRTFFFEVNGVLFLGVCHEMSFNSETAIKPENRPCKPQKRSERLDIRWLGEP